MKGYVILHGKKLHIVSGDSLTTFNSSLFTPTADNTKFSLHTDDGKEHKIEICGSTKLDDSAKFFNFTGKTEGATVDGVVDFR